MRDFHVRRTARERYGIESTLFGLRGDLIVGDLAAVRRLAARMAADRPAGTPVPGAADIAALGVLHEVGHRLIERFGSGDDGPATPHGPSHSASAMHRALQAARVDAGPAADAVLDRFGDAFPGRHPDPEPPEARLEELLLTRIANENPALGPLQELVDDRDLAASPDFNAVLAGAERALGAGGGVGDDRTRDITLPDGRRTSLLELIREPARHSPGSLVGQLRFVRERWADLLGDDFEAVLGRLELAIGVLLEQERGLARRFGGGDPGPRRRPVEAPALAPATPTADEPEAFSTDSAWMPRLVLMAKSTYVWLDQLSRRYGREIRTLDAIPDEELDTLASWGVTGLWLIGLWQRSVASERIKRMRGNDDAVASAYSLDDYRIADDLGGEAAHADLRERAWARGIRLASDMVPNHMGIDSRWVVEHPDWFLSVPEPPFPTYSYTGPDLSPDPRVRIVLEDHYWDDSDAAVVFQRVETATGETRYVYHGNDGTSFPWNDTAQLDFLRGEVREAVIQVILDVARRFPVIRFDAAMVLAKRHIQRLWWPLPGAGDAIPSRAEHAMSQAAFDALMPVEFWREVVDRVAAEVPGTLLLAEAFWMLEGYFVRTLGMHRVYNSAFMHMLRDEDGAGYRKLIRETLEFDPEILKRYVNFMSNPDEETAVEQFGKGDKYVGVAMVMATLPGLPMLGHGQVEGFAEKYGMEFRRARLEERPDPWLLDRHRREVFPLLHRRSWFAEADDFELFDLVTPDGTVDEHVLAYTNGRGPTRSLVVYHVRFGSTAGRLHRSTPATRRSSSGARRPVRRTIAEALGTPDDPAAFVRFRDPRTGLEHLRSCADLHANGWELTLDAYEGHVFWEFDVVRDGSAGQWRRLHDRLAGRGVPSLDAELQEQQLEPVHGPLRAVFAGGHVAAVLAGTAETADLDALEAALARLLGTIGEATAVEGGDVAVLARQIREEVATAYPDAADGLALPDRAALLGWLALSRIGALAPGAAVAATSAAWYDELRLAPVVAVGLRSAELDEATAWATADRIGTLLALPRASRMGPRGRARDRALIEAWLADDRIRMAMGVHTWDGVEWLDGDRLVALARWAVRLDAADGVPADRGLPDRLATLAAAAGYRVDTLHRPAAEKQKTRSRAK